MELQNYLVRKSV